jgi:uncharacterized protein (TIGR02246 family)
MTPDDLVEIAQIHQLKYRYVRCIDTKAWDELAGLFTDDATAAYGGGATTLSGRPAIMEFLTTSMASETMLTSHKVHQPEITLTGPGAATGVWALDDVVIMHDLGLVVRGASFYVDRYVKVDGAWLIAHTGYRRVFEELEPRSPEVRLTASWWGTDGRSSLQ